MTTVPYLYTPGKSAADVLDFSADFGLQLVSGETITNATVTAEPAGLTIGQPSIAGAVVTVWVGGGSNGTTYSVLYAITTSAGRIEQRSVLLPVVQL